MPSSVPTRREIVLVVLLLVFLLFTFSGPRLESAHGQEHLHDAVLDHRPTGAANSTDITFQPSDALVQWSAGKIPRTNVVAHVPGWTIFDRIYALNGTLYIVTDHPEDVPDRNMMISTAVPIFNGAIEEAKRVPTDNEMQIITPARAEEMFGSTADRLDGVSWLANDSPQFITHYYHWSAELFFGFWRTYSSLDPLIPSDGTTVLPPPRRLIFLHSDSDHWRDYANMNQWVVRSAFPSLTMEYNHDWRARAETGRPLALDRVVLADRAAAMHGYNFLRTQRTASAPFALPGSVHWWSVVRNNVVRFAGLDTRAADRPVITYISRQDWGRRMLIQADHEGLVRELYRLRDEHGYEVNVVSMDKLSRIDQLALAGRTTIMMGVHGNGLTSLVWMKPSARATVMEFFFPGGFAHDYEYTTRALGMVHYGFWGDTAFTRPNEPPVAYPEGFQGNSIPIDGALVARLCVERIELDQELDEA